MNNANVLTEAAVLTQVNKFVGVFIALVGAFITAPDGARLVFRSSAAWARKQINRFRKPPTKTIQVSAAGFAGITGTVTMTATGRVWDPNAPVDERIETLRSYISDVETRLSATINRVTEERAAREKAIEDLSRTLHAKVDELYQLLKEKEEQTAIIDGRGLPVIGVGILLTGIPEALAEIPWHLGWLLPFGGFGLMVAAVMASVNDHRAKPNSGVSS
jgi:Zn-ribbon protein, possibly nucleic acid-binding